LKFSRWFPSGAFPVSSGFFLRLSVKFFSGFFPIHSPGFLSAFPRFSLEVFSRPVFRRFAPG
jgi:hypothetical protein